MKLPANKISEISYRPQRNTLINNVSATAKSPLFNQISFGACDVTKIIGTVSNDGKYIKYSNITGMVDAIDKLIGDKTFSNLLQKAGINFKNGEIIVPKTTLGEELIETIKYPLIDLPRDLTIKGLNFLKNKKITKKAASHLLESKVFTGRMQKAETEKALQGAMSIIDTFFPQKIGKKGVKEFDFDKCLKNFTDKTCSNILATTKEYKSRDERTLNRMATATVSAIYSGWDFYNISMLQKNDDKEAKKAQKGRFKQEITRMLLGASMTFLSLGALNKYTKDSIPLNALVIAGSSLLSEVLSRIVNGTPLTPLSPEAAKKYAQNNNKKQKSETIANNNTKEKHSGDTSFKGKTQNEIFSRFLSNDGTFTPLKSITFQNAKAKTPNNKKGKITAKTVFKAAFLISSLSYIASKIYKGDLRAKLDAKKALNPLIEEYRKINPEGKIDFNKIEISDKKRAEIENIAETFKDRSDKYNISKKIREKITKRKVEVNVENIKDKLDELSHDADAGIFKEFSAHAQTLIDNNLSTFSQKKDIPGISGLYCGVAKLANTLYQIFSLPASILDGLLNKTVFKDSSDIYNKITNDSINKKLSLYKKEMGKLNDIFSPNKKIYGNFFKQKKVNTAEEIKRNVKNYGQGNTSDLANLSRTMVTICSTYFFVNDYTNKVLIESEGRDVDKAHEVRNERIGQKAANFVINGTLMNIFNAVFNKQLNHSLLEATAIAAATETTNEFLVRKSICQPILPRSSRRELLSYEKEQMEKTGLMGAWSRLFKRITGKKSLSQKAGIETEKTKEDVDKFKK